MSRVFKSTAELGLTRIDLESIIQEWFRKQTVGLAEDKVSKITIHTDAKYVVRVTFNEVSGNDT